MGVIEARFHFECMSADRIEMMKKMCSYGVLEVCNVSNEPSKYYQDWRSWICYRL